MKVLIYKLLSTFKQFRWKLTLSYMAVTAGTLLIILLIMGAFFFSRILIPDRWFTPEKWNEVANQSAVPIMRNILSQSPIDPELISIWLNEIDMRITSDESSLLGTKFTIETVAQIDVLVIGADGILWGVSNPNLVDNTKIGQPFNADTITGLNAPLQAALKGEQYPDLLFVTVDAGEKLLGVVPVLSDMDTGGQVLGVIVGIISSPPTQNDVSTLTAQLAGRGLFVFLLGAGVVGAIFGSFTTKSMSKRFRRLTEATDAWSEGNFTEFIDDTVGDEISQLAQRLNNMAEQLQDLLQRRQAMAISEERNRLARDLHDSAKQQALAASFQLGTAITLFESDPERARQHLAEADNLVDSVRKELTDLILELRPPAVDGRDFTDIMHEYAIEWAHQNGIEIDINVNGYHELPLNITQTLYRILQEALANIARHSSAKNAYINLSHETNAVKLSIIDDGCGFKADEQHDGMGLYSMRERAESVNGICSIESEPGQGTRIFVSIPLS
jgi:NarL family two-component system sensor histidine kinase LiaS